MTERSRFLASIGEAQVGDHLCWVYADDDLFRFVLTRYVVDGLRQGERVACYLPSEAYDDTLRFLESVTPAVSEAIARGALLLGTTEEAYLPDGTFDPDLRLYAYAAMVRRAVADGYSALRVLGEATMVVTHETAREGWPSYELRGDLLAARLPFTGLCAYDARRCGSAELTLLRSVHARSFGSPSRDSAFHLHASPTGALSLGGEIDFACSDAVERLASDAVRDLSEPALDLSGLEFIDGAGMRAVVRGLRAMGDRHGRIEIRGAGPSFKRLWRLLDCPGQIDAEVELV